jgi:hypothetical protein
MFLLEPNSHVMKKVAAFMYGNKVRLSDAVGCYNVCKGRHQSRVETVVKAYFVWDRNVNQRHKEQYYSIILKCQAWINGKARDQYELVKPVGTVSKFGPAGTRYPGRIGLTIESIRSSSSVE